MNIAELTKALQRYVETSQKQLEEILSEPLKEYLEATLSDEHWFAAIMHTSGSEADEAMRLARILEATPIDELTEEVTQRLASGIISTTLMPAVLPTPLLSATNQSILSCLRDLADES